MKKGFMEIVDKLGTPLMIGSRTQFDRNAPDVPITEYKGDDSHTTIVAGVTMGADGTVYVMHRDSNDPPDTYQTLTLTEFLTPRYIPAIGAGFRRNPSKKDELCVGQMRADENTRDALTNRRHTTSWSDLFKSFR